MAKGLAPYAAEGITKMHALPDASVVGPRLCSLHARIGRRPLRTLAACALGDRSLVESLRCDIAPFGQATVPPSTKNPRKYAGALRALNTVRSTGVSPVVTHGQDGRATTEVNRPFGKVVEGDVDAKRTTILSADHGRQKRHDDYSRGSIRSKRSSADLLSKVRGFSRRKHKSRRPLRGEVCATSSLKLAAVGDSRTPDQSTRRPRPDVTRDDFPVEGRTWPVGLHVRTFPFPIFTFCPSPP